MPVIHLLRHGHVHNPERVLYGRLPEFRLSDAGQEMARAVARHLKAEGRDIRRVVASPLLRAQQTARAIADEFGLKVETDERLIESENSFQGERMRPFARFLVRPRRLWSIRNPVRPSWGEPYVEQKDRMIAAVMDAARAQPEGETVLVSHQLPIWVTRLAAEGRRLAHLPGSRRCALASLTSLTVESGEIVKVDYAQPARHVVVPK